MRKHYFACLITLMALLLPDFASAQPASKPEPSKPVEWTPETITALPVDEAYKIVYDMWADGDQAHSQVLATWTAVKYPKDLKVFFFNAACVRSRFDIKQGDALFEHVIELAPDSEQAECARILLKLDSRQQIVSNFAALKRFVAAHNDDALYVWMAGVQCRSLNMNEDGVKFYKHLCELVHPGSSLVHQTFANLLDELKKYDESMVHREMAVQLEPAGWSYQGMANTLDSLKRYDEASRFYAKAVGMDPDSALYWNTWASSLYRAEKFDQAVTAARRATILNPTDWGSFNLLAFSLDQLGRKEEALDQFKKVRELAPKESQGYTSAAAILDKLGRTDEANKLREEWKRASRQN